MSSPSRIRTNALAKRISSRQHSQDQEEELKPDKQEETLSREVTEKKTTVEGSPVRDGNRETFTKTTITEKEEKVHKTQYVRFTGVSEQGIEKLVTKYADESGDDDDENKVTSSSTTRTITHKTSKSRSPSPSSRRRSASPSKRRTPSPMKDVPGGGIVTSARRQMAAYDEETFGESGRKKRLAALAKKFQRYDDEDEAMEGEEAAPVPAEPCTPSARDKSVTKEVDVDEELQEIYEAAEERAREVVRRRSASPAKDALRRRSVSPFKETKNMAKDPEFIKSLRAQGFEETESKTKLVYDFSGGNGKRAASPTRTAILSSPTKTAAEPRPTSPFKPHPLQFVSPQVNKEVAAAARNSPVKATPPPPAPPKPRPSSPYKAPHPMQFISPQQQRARSPSSRPVPASEPPRPPPNKPARTWAAAAESQDEEDMEVVSAPSWRTEATVQVTNNAEFATPSRPPAPAPKPPQSEPMTDTASRRSLAEKWSMFEGRRQQQDDSPDVDPAMMTLSERRALFEKNRTAPKPVARFGDAVTPSMLSAGQGRVEGAMAAPPPQPKQLFASRSPPRMRKPSSPPAKKRAPSPPAPSAALKRPASPVRQQPSPKRGGGSPSRRRERSNSPKKMILRDDWKQQEQDRKR